ncbi:MAG: hypothetical protein UV78_C0019G0004 [Parcubacteria group bacterium GW2011_GWA2_43_17]|nr:MAG: hypothetical protein UV78_C0019G0004 [Parcubacteria group bacterium GW2011_GWA2_43_17]KKT98828.1 MAG: hypothetical protein UW98_C0001G0004 [Parcubacteria group bacterium GW2011_GWC2_45_15]OGY93410.1 MAG: hypothetical protein A2260_01370 [Candidatus Komeilibacteria bacterium RIFOXYA2_FULL_45_9]OGY96132.1 MAG: hypothetical protein A3J95_03510 [Candidatus Komeilibacteria bacterium RIFOXYC2_FULL_45_12]HAH04300.1 glutamyl-tRNA amidotransferase [Candidatus Komeilibacteria bacterium]
MTEISQRLDNNYLESAKAKDQKKIDIYRLLKSALKNEQIAKRAELKEEDIIKVLKKEAKKRQEAIEVYHQGRRLDLEAQEAFELSAIQRYLPAELDDQTIKDVVTKIIKDNVLGQQDFGRAMKLVMSELAGRADGARVSPIVKELLA